MSIGRWAVVRPAPYPPNEPQAERVTSVGHIAWQLDRLRRPVNSPRN